MEEKKNIKFFNSELLAKYLSNEVNSGEKLEVETWLQQSKENQDELEQSRKMLEKIVTLEKNGEDFNKEVAYTYLSTMLGRTYDETLAACERFANSEAVNSIFHITYWLGKLSFDEATEGEDREISFSSSLREKIGHHVYGELWANI